MATRYRYNAPTPRQRDYAAFKCQFGMPMPDHTTTLTVTHKRRVVAQAVDLESADVRSELHCLRNLYPLSEHYDITAIVKERDK